MKHDSFVAVLDAVAILSGRCERLPLNFLPDGSRPDVLRLERQRKVLFIGDAKNGETSGNRTTQLRLRTYVGSRRFDMDSCWICRLKISGAGTVYNFYT
jgi:hypothetical protein